MKNVMLIGAGAIGSRHLQSLSGLDGEWSITVVEPNAANLSVAQERYREVAAAASPQPRYISALDGVPEQVDVCILATPAPGRLDLIEEIFSRTACRFMILEKVAFQSPADFRVAEKRMADAGTAAWVNCPRRQWPIFQELKAALHGSERVELYFSRSRFAMACNAVHLIDTFQFITGIPEVQIDASALSAPILDDKRTGYLEFSGTMRVTNERGDTFTMTGYETDEAVPPVMVAMSDRYRWIFNQLASSVSVSSAETDWAWISHDVRVPPQSQLSSKVVQSLMDTGNCELATLAESRLAHEPMLNAFLDRIEMVTGERPDRCNIT